jgi:hypothetical protein
MLPLRHHPDEKDYCNAELEVTYSGGAKVTKNTIFLRVYPETFDGCDAYMDILMNESPPDIKTVHSSKLGTTWEVIGGAKESEIRGNFRGDHTENNPPVWMFGLRKI